MYNSRFSSVKVYRRYGFGAIFSGLCSLGILAMFAILAFFPLFFFKTESNPEGSLISGLDFVFYGIRKFYAALDTHKLDAFAESLSTYGDNNQFLKYVVQFREYIEIGLVGILAIAVIMAAIVGIVGLFWILLGRIHFTKTAASLSKSILFFYILFVGLTFLYLFLANEVFKGGTGGAHATFVMPFFPFVVAGGLLVLTIMVNVTYSACFKDRVFAPRKKEPKGEEVKAVFVDEAPVENKPVNDFNNCNNNNNNNYGNNYSNNYNDMPPSQPYYDNRPIYPSNNQAPRPANGLTSLPPGLREIGDRSFSRNTTLREANITQGVSKIGASAFSNCLALETVTIPTSVREIGYNCFFNTPSLKRITYLGTVEDWKRIRKGSNWLSHSGANIIDARDGRIAVSNR